MAAQFSTYSRKAVAAILVLWIGLIALGPLAHDGFGHDEDWAPVLVRHDASHHRVDNAPFPPLQGEEHCAVCHLFCGSRHIASPAVSVYAAFREWFVVPSRNDRTLVASAIVPLPARAPPLGS